MKLSWLCKKLVLYFPDLNRLTFIIIRRIEKFVNSRAIFAFHQADELITTVNSYFVSR